ncbi:MAG: peptide chain release factor N(5)-glutamine methyltransferase [Clostridia bacterium]|nr:peptide chain release factor N(5)-glutamine methyltransferase [Clostridia bacterium]
MTFEQVYFKGQRILKEANIPDFAFDARCIFEHCFKIKRMDLALYRSRSVPSNLSDLFFRMISDRQNHRPLQYILGQWDFMGNTFKVGEGVLIPRDDTEVLVNIAHREFEKYIKHKSVKVPTAVDLCSGSGVIAITLAKKFPFAKFIAVEFSDIALNFLQENVRLNNVSNVIPLKFDVLRNDRLNFLHQVKNVTDLNDVKFDLIVSNPPYIKTSEIKSLQLEVQKEPIMALDGGADGLEFYKSILYNWSHLLKQNASLYVEIGFAQKNSVIELFEEAKFENIKAFKDINGLNRVISGRKA